MQCILTAGDFWEASTPGLLGLAQHCQPLILLSCWSARAGEIPVCYVSVGFFSSLLDSNMFHSHRVYFLGSIKHVFVENPPLSFSFSQERAADNIHGKSCKGCFFRILVVVCELCNGSAFSTFLIA